MARKTHIGRHGGQGKLSLLSDDLNGTLHADSDLQACKLLMRARCCFPILSASSFSSESMLGDTALWHSLRACSQHVYVSALAASCAHLASTCAWRRALFRTEAQ